MHNNMNVNVSGPVQTPAMQSYQAIVLKYNIVDGHNLLTQEIMSQEDTIYVIKWDFELAEDITIPTNCALQFDGGSISGVHTITGANTGIQAGLVKIFNTDVTLTGTWNVAEAYPEWFGAKGDGVTDDYIPINKVVNSPFIKVIFTKNLYIITDTIELTQIGIHISGLLSNRFGRHNTIKNNVAGKGVFHITQAIHPGQYAAPQIENLGFIADYPLMYNNPETAVITDSSDTPYIMNPLIINCCFQPLTIDFGIGITMCKAFDGRIQSCEICGFESGVYLLGCDINVITNNRIWQVLYAVVDISVNTFGSQNIIDNNDLLGIRTGGAAIKSTDRHAIIQNNYIETGNVCYGFDLTKIGISKGGNSNLFAVTSHGNRFEGPNGTFIRIDDTYRYADINEISGATSLRSIEVVDASGNPSYLKMAAPNFDVYCYNIVISNLFNWNNYKNLVNIEDSLNNYMRLDDNTIIPRGVLYGNNAYQHIRHGFDHLIFYKSCPVVYISESVMGVTFKRECTYIVRITAKSHAEGVSSKLVFIKIRGYQGYGSSIIFETTDEYTSIDIPIEIDNTYSNQGVALVGINNDADIKSIEIFIADYGTTSQRPAYSVVKAGFRYFDTTLNKPIYWTGSAWVDATGTTV